MPTDVAKCDVSSCEKYSTCNHGQSKSDVFYDFKHVCKDYSMYSERFEGMYREIPKVKESGVEGKCEGDEDKEDKQE